mmetsp:Transcript_17622/g.42269  ORF Transcript_17622/g.42269 Transcript_17622/m.42269 type:complete len:214 (-) Transcript_17622:2613-3254(-)
MVAPPPGRRSAAAAATASLGLTDETSSWSSSQALSRTSPTSAVSTAARSSSNRAFLPASSRASSITPKGTTAPPGAFHAPEEAAAARASCAHEAAFAPQRSVVASAKARTSCACARENAPAGGRPRLDSPVPGSAPLPAALPEAPLRIDMSSSSSITSLAASSTKEKVRTPLSEPPPSLLMISTPFARTLTTSSRRFGTVSVCSVPRLRASTI